MKNDMNDIASLFNKDNENQDGGLLYRQQTGILACQDLRWLIDHKHIVCTDNISEDQIQPASIDLRLGKVAYRVHASFLPGPESTVRKKIEKFSMHAINLTDGAVLERGCVYIVELQEQLSLRKRYSGIANPKSSIGRLDVFTRVITDRGVVFDRVPEGYKGPLYAEIAPRTFGVVVREGDKVCQLRIRYGSPPSTEARLKKLQEEYELFGGDLEERQLSASKVPVRVDLRGVPGDCVVGYRAKHHTQLIELSKTNHYDPEEYWEPISPERGGGLILDPGDFYILASKEAVKVPPTDAAEMIAYDTLVGEFRVHYAGFFDPGFGYEECDGSGARAVLEVRSYQVPFMIEDGQLVGQLVYERLTAVPDKLYGAGIGSSYQRQGLALAKQFKKPPALFPT